MRIGNGKAGNRKQEAGREEVGRKEKKRKEIKVGVLCRFSLVFPFLYSDNFLHQL